MKAIAMALCATALIGSAAYAQTTPGSSSSPGATGTTNRSTQGQDSSSRAPGTSQSGGTMRSFKSLDRDGNGNISEAEAKGAFDTSFSTIDADGDGTISNTEFDNWQAMQNPSRKNPDSGMSRQPDSSSSSSSSSTRPSTTTPGSTRPGNP